MQINSRTKLDLTSLVLVVLIYLFGDIVQRQVDFCGKYLEVALSFHWLVLICASTWLSVLIALTFRKVDIVLIGFLIIIGLAFLECHDQKARSGLLVLLIAIIPGRMVRMSLSRGGRLKEITESGVGLVAANWFRVIFLICLFFLLSFASLWHLDNSRNFYRGPRWMGLWSNPNIYGILMGVGVVICIGFLAGRGTSGRTLVEGGKANEPIMFASGVMNFFITALGCMTGFGLIMSYSRGAWIGTLIGLLYLAHSHFKNKCKKALIVSTIIAGGIFFMFWNNTLDSDPWYIKRLDFARPSVQHRLHAWRAALKIMWDYPSGVGWGNALLVYERDYSPPEEGSVALMTNDYFMLGTQLGWIGLACFMAYSGLCFWDSMQTSSSHKIPHRKDESKMALGLVVIICKSASIVMLIAFFFDGGLFTLATASVFWVLLELGVESY